MRFLGTVIAVSFLLFNCNSSDPELERLKTENNRLKRERAVADSILNILSSAYTQIDSNISKIEMKKQNISSLARKGQLSKKEKQFILAEMDSIRLLMDQNKNRVGSLDSSLSVHPMNNAGFSQMVKGMDEKNSTSDVQLHEMKTELASISKDFSNLFEDFVYKEAENMEMKEKLYSAAIELEAAKKTLGLAQEKLKSAWYIVGTKTELKEKGLVLKKGFFDDNNMSEDFDKSLFKKIDIYELNEIILDSRKAELITTHPSESYELVGMKKKVSRLVIVKPELFWSVSKFLIIEVE